MASSIATLPLTLPAAFTERLARIIPSEHLDSVLATFATPHAVGFRINTLKAPAEAVLARLADEGLDVEPVRL